MSKTPIDVRKAARDAATEVWKLAGINPHSDTALGFSDETTGVQIAIRAILEERKRCAAKLSEALAKYDEGMSLIGGCGDGNRLVFRPGGQHTNGGCRCYSDRMTAQRSMSRGRWLAEEIRKAVA